MALPDAVWEVVHELRPPARPEPAATAPSGHGGVCKRLRMRREGVPVRHMRRVQQICAGKSGGRCLVRAAACTSHCGRRACVGTSAGKTKREDWEPRTMCDIWRRCMLCCDVAARRRLRSQHQSATGSRLHAWIQLPPVGDAVGGGRARGFTHTTCHGCGMHAFVSSGSPYKWRIRLCGCTEHTNACDLRAGAVCIAALSAWHSTSRTLWGGWLRPMCCAVLCSAVARAQYQVTESQREQGAGAAVTKGRGSAGRWARCALCRHGLLVTIGHWWRRWRFKGWGCALQQRWVIGPDLTGPKCYGFIHLICGSGMPTIQDDGPTLLCSRSSWGVFACVITARGLQGVMIKRPVGHVTRTVTVRAPVVQPACSPARERSDCGGCACMLAERHGAQWRDRLGGRSGGEGSKWVQYGVKKNK